MTIRDVVRLMVDPGFFKLDIYDLSSEKMIFSGFAEDIPSEFDYLEIMSFDLPVDDTLCINVEKNS